MEEKRKNLQYSLKALGAIEREYLEGKLTVERLKKYFDVKNIVISRHGQNNDINLNDYYPYLTEEEKTTPVELCYDFKDIDQFTKNPNLDCIYANLDADNKVDTIFLNEGAFNSLNIKEHEIEALPENINIIDLIKDERCIGWIAPVNNSNRFIAFVSEENKDVRKENVSVKERHEYKEKYIAELDKKILDPSNKLKGTTKAEAINFVIQSYENENNFINNLSEDERLSFGIYMFEKYIDNNEDALMNEFIPNLIKGENFFNIVSQGNSENLKNAYEIFSKEKNSYTKALMEDDDFRKREDYNIYACDNENWLE